MKVEIVKLDNLGNGIGYVNNKIVFVPKSLPGDILEIEIVKEKKKFQEGKIIKIITPSSKRKDIVCPYYFLCGGCNLMGLSYEDMISYKKSKVDDLLFKNGIDYKVDEIFYKNQFEYRNKVTLKIKNGEIGYYEENTHKLVSIDKCILLLKPLNDYIEKVKLLNINNGNIMMRCNNRNEVLISINSEDSFDYDSLICNSTVGIIINDDIKYGNDYIYEYVSNYVFKVNYKSFFQVNLEICEILFDIVKKVSDNKKVLDLYSGVGSLSMVCNKEVLGVEIVNEAVVDANFNVSLNDEENKRYICSDTKEILNEINNYYDMIILDPPRSGVNDKVLNKIIDEKINEILYVSCNPITLIRDLKILSEYKIKSMYLLDMFPNTYHCESLVVLERI